MCPRIREVGAFRTFRSLRIDTDVSDSGPGVDRTYPDRYTSLEEVNENEGPQRRCYPSRERTGFMGTGMRREDEAVYAVQPDCIGQAFSSRRPGEPDNQVAISWLSTSFYSNASKMGTKHVLLSDLDRHGTIAAPAPGPRELTARPRNWDDGVISIWCREMQS